MTNPKIIAPPKIVKMTKSGKAMRSNRVGGVVTKEAVLKSIKIHNKFDFIGSGYYFMLVGVRGVGEH